MGYKEYDDSVKTLYAKSVNYVRNLPDESSELREFMLSAINSYIKSIKEKTKHKMCECYHTEKTQSPLYSRYTGEIEGYCTKTVGVCWGTKECDECSCGGDEEECDFYPEKRNRF